MLKRLMCFLMIIAMFFMATSFLYAQDSAFSENEGILNLPLTSFYSSDGSATILPITQSTAPGLEVDNTLPSLVWADAEVTPVSTTFRVPKDYYKGGEFRVLCDSSNTTTKNQVDFNVYVNQDGAAWDSSATNQTPVAMTETAGTPEVVALRPATDFNALQPNQYVTLNVWRDNTATGTGDLEIYNIQFYYKKKLQ